MSLKIELDLNDIFPEPEHCNGEGGCTIQSIGESIRENITWSIKNKIMDDIRDSIQAEVTKVVKDHIEQSMKIQVKAIAETYTVNSKFKFGYQDEHEKTFAEWLHECFRDEARRYNIGDFVKREADRYAKTIKERFDVVFASTLLDKMMKADLLKDDRISKLLLDDKKED